ncbi:MAG: hypothetical protein II013_00890 [Lachnobacterium sp.]|jgi:hypothetical protein|nr:hypothetical protein [Lachnobacterium sp.]
MITVFNALFNYLVKMLGIVVIAFVGGTIGVKCRKMRNKKNSNKQTLD